MDNKDKLDSSAESAFFDDNKKTNTSKSSKDADLFFSDSVKKDDEKKTEKVSLNTRPEKKENINTDMEKPEKKSKRLKHILIFILLAVMVGAGTVYGMGAYYYTSHFLRGTVQFRLLNRLNYSVPFPRRTSEKKLIPSI